MARLVAGAASGKPFLDPEKVAGVAHLGAERGRRMGVGGPGLPGGIIAEVSCSVSLAQDNMLRILGTEGRIEVADFWFASGRQGGTGDDRDHRPRRRRAGGGGGGGPLALCLRGGRGGRGDPGRAAGVRPAGDDLGRHPRQPARARQVAGGRGADLWLRAGGGAAADGAQHPAGARPADPAAGDPGAGAADLGAGAGVRGLPEFRGRFNPLGRVLRARRHALRHRLDLRRRADRDGLRRVAAGAGGAGRGRRSSARGRIRR